MTPTRIALVVLACTAVAAGSAFGAVSKQGALVKLHATSLGKVLVAANGRTLYLYTPDSRNKSNCYGACAASWPPLLTTAKPKARGVKPALLGTTRRKDGKLQVTYKGHPLYFFAGDTKAGDVNGEEYGGIWYAVSAKGAKVEPKSNASNTSTTTTPDPVAGGGYSYGP